MDLSVNPYNSFDNYTAMNFLPQFNAYILQHAFIL